MNLKLRLALSVTIVATVALAGTGWLAVQNTQAELIDGIDEFLDVRAADFSRPDAPTFEEHRLLVPTEPPADLPLFAEADTVSVVIGPDGTRLSPPGTPELPTVLVDSDEAPQFRTVTVGGTEYRMIIVAIPEGGSAQVARDLTEANDVVRGLTTRLALGGTVGLAAIAAAVWLLVTRSLTPMERVTSAAERIADSMNLDEQIEVARSDEVGRLASSFNTMTAALAVSREQQQRFVDDAAHELRTPLAGLKTRLETLEQLDRLPPERRTRLIGNARRDLDSLTDLVDELVRLARNPEELPAATDVDLESIVRTLAESATARHDRPIEVTATAARPIRCVEPLVARAVNNLIDNAIKFSPPGQPIEILVGDRTVEVLDRGSGIDPEHLSQVFERFHRAPEARSLPGSGLGLAIVASVAQHHGGEAWAKNRPGGGSRVGFSLGQD